VSPEVIGKTITPKTAIVPAIVPKNVTEILFTTAAGPPFSSNELRSLFP